MASSNETCAITKCEVSSCATCHCCKMDLCIDHLKEHKDRLNSQLSPVAHQVNTLVDDLQKCDRNSLPCFKLFEQWRIEAHKTIDQFYERMWDELFEQRKNTTLNQLRTLCSTLDTMIRKQGATREKIDLLNNDIRLIEEEINNLKNLKTNLNPLVIDENLIIQSDYNDRKQRRNMNDRQPARLTPYVQTVFQIFVQLPTNKTILVTIEPTDTIRKIKERIAEREGIPIERQQLTMMGKYLQDEERVATYDIQKQSTLKLTFLLNQSLEKK